MSKKLAVMYTTAYLNKKQIKKQRKILKKWAPKYNWAIVQNASMTTIEILR